MHNKKMVTISKTVQRAAEKLTKQEGFFLQEENGR